MIVIIFRLLYEALVQPSFFLSLCHAFGHFSGSVIKQQLVTHLTLGIALRGVLDALRKPADSKVSVIY